MKFATSKCEICDKRISEVFTIDFDIGDPEVGPQPDVINMCKSCYQNNIENEE